jgi:cyanophycinase
MIRRISIAGSFFLVCWFSGFSQPGGQAPKGKLFIIGGGYRSEEMMKLLVSTAGLGSKDYVAVLPMSTEEPDSGFYYFKESLEPVCSNSIVNLNFTSNSVNDRQRLDSLAQAKLIFITGGDQVRFMNVVLHTPVYDAIHLAYKNGATIAGTSAGAAVMSKQMITGNQLSDTIYHETFRQLKTGNVEIKEGLGLLDSAVIDQHFIVRSRYNRLLSALEIFPAYNCIGIDEATAIIVQNKKVTVTGDGQVILFTNPAGTTVNDKGLIKFKDLRLSIFTAGDSFMIK